MNTNTILIVDDDPSIRDVLSETLRLEKYSVITVETAEQALKKLEQTSLQKMHLKSDNGIDLILSDLKISSNNTSMNGNELLKTCKMNYPDIPFILMTGNGSIENAVQVMHEGASDYLTKPFNTEALIDTVKRFILSSENKPIKIKDDFIAVDNKSIQLAEISKRVALTEASVLISGESGVGKEVVSHYIHQHSERAEGPFIAINCAAIPENMLESELFGYEKGAFTGAYQAKSGKFEQAQGGTLLLDEITEMDLALQAKLLRVLQEREVERLGGRKVISLDVRILATTNRNIYQSVSDGCFREDLFYRINVFPLHISSLRERQDDILPLANKILKHHSTTEVSVDLSEKAKHKLINHSWPGNVRELDNVIQRALILKTGGRIEANDIHLESDVSIFNSTLCDLPTNVVNIDESNLSGDLRSHEQDLIISALKTKTSRKEVAEKLGISSRTLRYKLAKMRDAGVAIPV